MNRPLRLSLAVVLTCIPFACSSSERGASSPAAEIPAERHALHNVHAIDDRIISGAVPESAAAFDELRSMGVQTIISVDGAAPDVESAAARGIRYVHIPITYAEVTDEQRLELARAVRDLPGPIYIHCHHGKHRSPAAAALIGVTLGHITPEQGVAFMETAGTAPAYAGLYACVAAARPLAPAAIDDAPGDFRPVRRPEGIVAAMVEADIAFEHVAEIRAAGWKTPADHPDLVPAAEAGRLVDLLRVSGDDPRSRARGDAFMEYLASSITAATELECAIVAGAPATDLERHYKLVQVSCKNCHAEYRDKP